jgi:hypothetical protein
MGGGIAVGHKADLDLPAHDVGYGQRRATVRHDRQIRLGDLLEVLDLRGRLAAAADESVSLGERKQLRQIAEERARRVDCTAGAGACAPTLVLAKHVNSIAASA